MNENLSADALPPLVDSKGLIGPKIPVHVEDTGIDPQGLADLALKAAYSVPQFNTDWMCRRLHLPQTVIAEILERLRVEFQIEVLGQAGPFGYRYMVAPRGRERAQRLLEISGYVGPAPVSLENYSAFLEWQLQQFPRANQERVSAAIGDLVLTQGAAITAGLAISSNRSLFLFGPPGNGKTSLGRLLHNALEGELWIPYCLELDHTVINIFDPHWHQPLEEPKEVGGPFDTRWLRIRRPFIVGGGEMTLHSCDLNYSPSLRFYQAPLHFKANGGTFLIDDFGRQRVEPTQLLNRWIIPLEHQIDYLTLINGQKIEVPFRTMLIVATNLKLEDVTDAAFLRRMGYRLLMDRPTPEQYTQIFEAYAQRFGMEVPQGLLAKIMERYHRENRELRGCEPRDLIERVKDVCSYRKQTPQLNEETLNLAWAGYFGQETKK